jgi:hypothetical protein
MCKFVTSKGSRCKLEKHSKICHLHYKLKDTIKIKTYKSVTINESINTFYTYAPDQEEYIEDIKQSIIHNPPPSIETFFSYFSEIELYDINQTEDAQITNTPSNDIQTNELQTIEKEECKREQSIFSYIFFILIYICIKGCIAYVL